MSDALPARTAGVLWLRIRPAIRASLSWLAPAVVVAVLFTLALNDGGRDPQSLAAAQVVVYALLVVLIWTGRARPSPVGRAVLFVLATMVLTSFTSVRPEASVRQILLWTLYVGILVIVESTVTSPQAARLLTDALVVIAGWLVLVALFMHWGAGNPGMRWYSTFYWPNPFAGFLLLVLPVELARYLRAGTTREAAAHGAMSALLGTAFVLTYSRGAWLSLAAVLPLMVWLVRPPAWRTVLVRKVLLGVAVAAAVVALTGRPSARSTASAIADRAVSVADPADSSIQGRLHFWRAALAIARDHPLLGTGPGTFGAVHPAYQRDVRYYAADAHSLYLQTLAESGPLGLGALGAVAGFTVVLIRRVLHRTRGSGLYPVATGAAVALLAFGLHSGVEMDWMFPATPALAAAWVGVLSAVDRMTGEPVAPARPGPSWRVAGAVGLSIAAVAATAGALAHRQFVRGAALARAGKWEEASGAYGRAVRWNPLSARYLGAQAAALTQVVPAQAATAQTLLRRAMTVDRVSAAYPLQLARLLMVQPPTPARHKEIEDLLTEALAKDPLNRPEAYRLLARLYLEQGRAEEAGILLERAVAHYRGRQLAGGMAYVLLWPEVAALYQDWAAYLRDHGRPEAAEMVLTALLRDDPSWTPAYLALAELAVRRGAVAEAARILKGGMAHDAGEVVWQRWRALTSRRGQVYER